MNHVPEFGAEECGHLVNEPRYCFLPTGHDGPCQSIEVSQVSNVLRQSLDLGDRHPGSVRFHEILAELGELHDRKQADYGTDSDPFANVRASMDWMVPPHVGALLRLNDKVVRLKSFTQKGSLQNESAEDSMRDIAVYAIIALVLLEEAKAQDGS